MNIYRKGCFFLLYHLGCVISASSRTGATQCFVQHFVCAKNKETINGSLWGESLAHSITESVSLYLNDSNSFKWQIPLDPTIILAWRESNFRATESANPIVSKHFDKDVILRSIWRPWNFKRPIYHPNNFSCVWHNTHTVPPNIGSGKFSVKSFYTIKRDLLKHAKQIHQIISIHIKAITFKSHINP